MLSKFDEFLRDNTAWDMYITGSAGTGKTTSLAELVQYCMDTDVKYCVCAYTHRACNVLRSKLPEGAVVDTLCAYLGKRPTINTNAKKTEHVDSTAKVRDTAEANVLFLDEYSMVGDGDQADILAAQDPEYEGVPKLKVIWIGDSHQLPPIKGQANIKPTGKYQVELTKQWRNDNPLQQPLNKLISYLDGEGPVEYLDPVPGYFERGVANPTDEDIVLAYTNRCVEAHNKKLQGRAWPEGGDDIYSPTSKRYYSFLNYVDSVDYIDIHYGQPLMLGSKYKTLEFLLSEKLCSFAELQNEYGDIEQFAVIFGHYQYKKLKESLSVAATRLNRQIEEANPGWKAAQWCRDNPHAPVARKRAKAWRRLLSFKDCVICIDFTHAMTVHNSQGSTFDSVYVDTNDLNLSADFSFELCLKLHYVAISRASKKVTTP